jgi:hypothetical protein
MELSPVKEPSPCKELSPWHAAVLTQLWKFAKTEYGLGFNVDFTERIEIEPIAWGQMCFEKKQIWLKIDEPLVQLVLIYGLKKIYVELCKLKLIEGEQYFLTLLHEIREALTYGPKKEDEDSINRWAVDEFKKKRELILSMLSSIEEKPP